MAQHTTSTIYKGVIDDVIDKMSNQFLTLGLDHVSSIPSSPYSSFSLNYNNSGRRN